MILNVDKEGKHVIEQLCDIALKQGGIQNLNQVNFVLKSAKLIPVSKLEDAEPETEELEDIEKDESKKD